MLCTKFVTSLKTSLKRSACPPLCELRVLIWTHCTTGMGKNSARVSGSLKIALVQLETESFGEFRKDNILQSALSDMGSCCIFECCVCHVENGIMGGKFWRFGVGVGGLI